VDDEGRQARRNSLADKFTVEAKALADSKVERAAVKGERRTSRPSWPDYAASFRPEFASAFAQVAARLRIGFLMLERPLEGWRHLE
jgi:hypothetical protein